MESEHSFSFSVESHHECDLWEPFDPQSYYTPISGSVYVQKDDSGDHLVIGEWSGMIVRVGDFLLDGHGKRMLADLFDEIGQDAYDLHRDVFNSKTLQEPLSEPLCCLLVLSRIELEAGWRGKGIGPVVARNLLREAGCNCDLAVLTAGPLHHEDHQTPEYKLALAKLFKTWKLAGFNRIGRTKSMYAKL